MSEVKLSQFDCGNCPNITDGCFGKCEKSNGEVIRMFVNWNMQEYFQHKDGDIVWFTDFDAQRLRADTAEAERDSLRESMENQVARTNDYCSKLTGAEQRNAELREFLRLMTNEYACCLEAGHDRITFLGGDCDSVSKMLSDNANYAKACAALNPNPEAESHEKY